MSYKRVAFKYFDKGYSNREICDKNIILSTSNNSKWDPTTIRSIQSFRKEWNPNYSSGQMSNANVFNLNEVYALMNTPQDTSLFESITYRASKRFYKKKQSYEKYINDTNCKHQPLKTTGLASIVIRNADYTCQRCGNHLNLEAHHLQNSGSLDPEDCVCLCKECHTEMDKIMRSGIVLSREDIPLKDKQGVLV
jgi:hypothetical protein